MVTIKPLSGISIDKVYEAFKKAFSDYVETLALSRAQLQYLLERRGNNLDLSFGAFQNGELVGFTLNGIGPWNGRLTAYDTGTGVIKEFRQQGIATRLFNESLPVLRENNIKQYLLEVIRTNGSAYKLYKKAGFKETRQFDYYICSRDQVVIRKGKLNHTFPLKEIERPDWDLFSTFWDFYPSWQNSIDSIKRKLDHFKILGAFEGNDPVGYGIIEPASGDIPQLGIDPGYRRKGLATTLLHRLLGYCVSDQIKMINACVSCDPLREFARSLKLIPGPGQYEMLKKL
ncbi:MAG: GNAT family N-acetyltransferase [Candidatus Krumholzibacteriota bacterium]|nr:GNAT family N-acetyltransferase [Candidatus Krumholzibacteriota bacterium]